MRERNAARALALLVGLAWCAIAFGAELRVGGDSGWTLGKSYDTIYASTGDVLVFDWESGQHNVVELADADCKLLADDAAVDELAGLTETPANIALDSNGTFHYACSVSGHCEGGMLVTVVVGEPESGSASNSSDGSIVLEPGRGKCNPPITDPASGLVTVQCTGPQIQLRPGQVVNSLFVFPDPYPKTETVGVVKSTALVREVTGREIPLSEVYLHHIFGANALVAGEGAEFRGSLLSAPLLPPYYQVITRGRFILDLPRVINVHVISTLGVAAADLQRCVECWCTDAAEVAAGFLGGTACCADALCPSAAPPADVRAYAIEFNTTYLPLRADTPVAPVYNYLLDTYNGSIEGDIAPTPGGGDDLVALTGPIDARCPQSAPVRVLGCVGHQHIGGTHLQLVIAETGEVICDSRAVYGSGPPDELGNEGGFLVAMTRPRRAQPLDLAPGTLVRLESYYENAVHNGVMALMFVELVDFDRTCPGPVTNWTGAAFGPDFANQGGTTFGFFDGDLTPQ